MFEHDLFCHQSFERILFSLALAVIRRVYACALYNLVPHIFSLGLLITKFGIYNYFVGHCHLSLSSMYQLAQLHRSDALIAHEYILSALKCNEDETDEK